MCPAAAPLQRYRPLLPLLQVASRCSEQSWPALRLGIPGYPAIEPGHAAAAAAAAQGTRRKCMDAWCAVLSGVQNRQVALHHAALTTHQPQPAAHLASMQLAPARPAMAGPQPLRWTGCAAGAWNGATLPPALQPPAPPPTQAQHAVLLPGTQRPCAMPRWHAATRRPLPPAKTPAD